MGVTLGKRGAQESEAALRFRRGVATVQVLNRIEKGDTPVIKYPPPQDSDVTDDYTNTQHLRVTQSDNDDDDADNVSRTIVYRDTTDAWAALMSGTVPEITATNTEFTMVDSALGGYKAVERVSEDMEKTLMRGYQKKESFTFDIPYEPPGGWDSIEEDPYVKCTGCGKGGGIIHSCRVCDNAYHESCLTRIGRLPDEESRGFFNRARMNIGWSCHDCESLGSVLHQDDMMELMEVFEKADVDDDAGIDLEEFIRYRRVVVKERADRDLTSTEEEDEAIQFRAMDTDRTGTLSWWEFLNHESLRRLASKPQKQLVKLLSEKEIMKARQNFRAFDTDLDGSITQYEAKRAYKKWYANFITDPSDMSPADSDEDDYDASAEYLLQVAASTRRRRLSMATDTQHTRQLTAHIEANTQLMMGADQDKSGTISWEEYLCEQALYIIAARPNLGPVRLKNKRPSFGQY